MSSVLMLLSSSSVDRSTSHGSRPLLRRSASVAGSTLVNGGCRGPAMVGGEGLGIWGWRVKRRVEWVCDRGGG